MHDSLECGAVCPIRKPEWEELRAHPAHTWQILQSISGFGALAEIAASHHEKLNGTGYHRGLVGSQMPIEARILMVSDIFDALAATGRTGRHCRSKPP